MQKSDNTIIWRVNDIPGSAGFVTNGIATDIGLNSVAINVTNGDPTFRTIPHEIGHAKYSFSHTDNYKSETETDPEIKDYETDGLSGPVNGDKYNFMNSGFAFYNWPVSSNSEFRIRRYQWNKIQLNH